ncbi:hypothetical protein WJX72_006620 [[Myrmecia] bisecta]|uniref:Uncharacterized protein n=1 Tax=[Myrmecia] bisecta TaxID=41462 RepID=A0AAW1QR37_9CHLO
MPSGRNAARLTWLHSSAFCTGGTSGASGAGLQAVLANSVKEGLPCCLIVADFDGEVAAYRWKKGEADATEEAVSLKGSKTDYLFMPTNIARLLPQPPQQPSEAHLLEVLRHILAVYEAKTSKHVEAKGVVLLLQMNK